MGIIAGALLAGGLIDEFRIDMWVVLSAHAAIALGTLSGGWRIIHTMGQKITRLQPVGGFAAETAGAISLFTATALGVPVSTTHTITGAIVGRGFGPPRVRGPLGHRRTDRLGLDPHHSGLRADCRSDVLPAGGDRDALELGASGALGAKECRWVRMRFDTCRLAASSSSRPSLPVV